MPEPLPTRVLVVGGAYAGLAAALNLQDLCRGLPARCAEPEEGEHVEKPQFAVDITIVDERDGYCELPFSQQHAVLANALRSHHRLPSGAGI